MAESRRDLFELSTELMLEEADENHSLKPSGSYSVTEVRPAAGALMAARLISDVEAIGIFEQAGTTAVPGYRGLAFGPRGLLRAALTRRVFIAGPAPHSADYAHRTTTEYLAAAWLADAVRGGLPFRPVQAMTACVVVALPWSVWPIMPPGMRDQLDRFPHTPGPDT